jgi:hypothetical protein
MQWRYRLRRAVLACQHKMGHFDEWHQNFGLNALKLINCFFKQINPSAFNNNNIYFACGGRNSAQQFHMVIG